MDFILQLLLDGSRLKQSPESSFTNLRKKNKEEERIRERREETQGRRGNSDFYYSDAFPQYMVQLL